VLLEIWWWCAAARCPLCAQGVGGPWQQRSREQGAGSREQGAGSREQGAGSREPHTFTASIQCKATEPLRCSHSATMQSHCMQSHCTVTVQVQHAVTVRSSIRVILNVNDINDLVIHAVDAFLPKVCKSLITKGNDRCQKCSFFQISCKPASYYLCQQCQLFY
jgi:hypothetical protein